MSELEILKRQLAREREARKQAESLLENKSRELFDSNQQLIQLNLTLEDLVFKRTSELEKEKEQLKHMIDEHPLPMLISTGNDNMIVNANKKAQQLFRCSLDEIIGREVPEFIQSELNSDLKNISGSFYTLIDNIKHELSCHCSNIEIDGIPGKLILLEDITEKNEMIEQISKKEKQYKNIVENSSDIIFICDENGKFKYINPTGFKLTGFTEEELMMSHFFKLVRNDYQKKLGGFYNFQIQSKTQSTYTEFPIICKDGRQIWLGQTVDLNINFDGEIEFFALSREITDRIKYEKAMIRSEEKFRSIIENLELGLLEVDRNGIIIKAYPQFCKLMGYSPEELLGKDPVQLLVDEESKKIILSESQKRKEGNSSVYEVKLYKKDKTPIWVMISGAPYYNERNEVMGTVGIHLDITQRKLMEEELREAKILAENSLKSKDLFVANISHEIRTPLNAIMGMSQLLEQDQLQPKQEQYVKAISKSSENLLLIVNDLLDFSKLEAGKMELSIENQRLYETIKEAANLWEYKIEEKEIEFFQQINIDKEYYQFDSGKLNGILTNLLHNALKFTEKGKISLIVETIERQKEVSTFRFKIEDTGIGISEHKIAQIFESFVQAEPGTSRKYGGTGLGLSITKNLIELMGGELKVFSKLDQGTTFQFDLTIQKGQQIEVIEPNISIDNHLFNGLNVLLVEDNQFNQMMAQTILVNWSMQVDIANNGIEALEHLRAKKYDLVLMDIQMPLMDGIEASTKIRNELKLSIPILALTANAMANDVKKYSEIGMNGFVLKPFRQNELFRTIKATLMLNIDENDENTSEDQVFNDQSSSSETICDLTNLHRNCMNNEKFIQKMKVIALQEIESKSIKIAESLNNKEFEEVKGIAHSLKPTIQNVAVERIFDLVKSVEKDVVDSAWISKTTSLISYLKQLKREMENI